MLKYLLTTAIVAVGVAAGASSASAADKYTFALVPKNTNNPFFDQALAGCKKAEKELNGAVECLYIGPGEHVGADAQPHLHRQPATETLRTSDGFEPQEGDGAAHDG